MPNYDSDSLPKVAIVLLLVLLVAVLLGGLAMAGMMGGTWHRDAVDNGTWHDGMMDDRHGGGLGWALLPIGLGVLVIIALWWLFRPAPAFTPQAQPYQPPVQHVPAQQPIAPQPYPMQPPARPPAPQQLPPQMDVARDILEERLARGEISEKDYLSTLETLKKGRSG